MKENYIKQEKLEKSLMIPESENIFTRFFNWVSNLFGKKQKEPQLLEEHIDINASIQTFTIPKAVKMPIRMEAPEEVDENSLEYLYKLNDEELDDLNKLYNEQMEEAKNEILKLDNILESYRQSIKKLQGKITEENI